MLVSVGNVNKIELFKIYENHNGNEKNIFLNSNIENFIESPPEILGNALADIWLCLAKKYEENQLDVDERETVFKNIHSILPKIKEKTDVEKELIHQFFVSKIASFSELECNCLIEFFKETIKFDLENSYSCMKKYYFFYAFIKLYNMLNSIDKSYHEKQSQERQIVDEIIKELEDYSKDVTALSALYQIPRQDREDIFKDYKKTTEISKFFKINKIFEESSDYTKNSCFNQDAKKLEFLREITNSKVTIDSLNLKDNDLDDYIKDQVLNYINLNGELPHNCEKILLGEGWEYGKTIIPALINWLGFEKTQQIKKLKLGVRDKLEYLNFIFPNLEEISLSLYSVNEKESKWFDDIHLFLNLKTLKLVNHRVDALSLCLSKLSAVKLPKNLELVLDLNFCSIGDIDEWSRKKCKEVFGKLPDIGHITKLKMIDHYDDKLNRCLNDEIQKIMFSKFVNVKSLSVIGRVNNIKNAFVFKNLKTLSYESSIYFLKIEKIIKSIQFFKQLTHLSLTNCNISLTVCNNIENSIIFPSLKCFYLNGKELPLVKVTENEVEGSSIYKPLIKEHPIDEKCLIDEKRPVDEKPFYEKLPLHEIRNELISIFYPEYVYIIPSRATKIKQLASISLLGLGISSLMKSAWGQPSSSSLPIAKPFGNVGMVAAGTFLTLAAGAAAYYYKTHNIKSKVLTSRRLKANHLSAKSS